ncbi:flagellin (plasmid) [Paracoccus sp. TK19116]|uniref:Flagellin n=1 Tax=Paracoccus albicereus TaxID=2922394 RepID=A0ABT1MLS5_9RHOB|nr:flagellin [Paracoccus albicereus]MCQ0969227.1 flagellin [Paracoccus albicereus]
MSSILTNNGAIVALQTLKNINSSLTKTQNEISTGKSVATAKDNAAVWSISKVMEAEVSGFKTISSNLSMASSAVATAQNGAEQISALMTQMRDAVIAAQNLGAGDTSSRDKVQADIDQLVGQIGTIVSSAQINGMNLLDGSTASFGFLASLDRSAGGTVTAGTIDVTGHDLSQGAYVAQAAFTGSTGASTAADTAAFTMDAATGTGTLVVDAGATYAAGDKLQVTIGGKTASYTFSAADVASTTPADLAAVGLKGAIEALGIADLTVDYDSGTAGTLVLTNGGASDLGVSAQYKNAGAGGLGLLSTITVDTPANASTALANIETMMQDVIAAASDFGSSGKRIDTQIGFLSKLTDTLTMGIGALVDANMEEASARLQALQTQQQLGIQSLSIANQAPSSILALFR